MAESVHYVLCREWLTHYTPHRTFPTAIEALEALSDEYTPGKWFIEKVVVTRVASRTIDHGNDKLLEATAQARARFEQLRESHGHP